MKTITSNEDYVRLRIYEGDLQISEAAAEIIRLERSQAAARERVLQEHIAALAEHCKANGASLG